MLTSRGQITAEHPCHLHPWDADIYHKIKEKVNEGAKLVKYVISFPEYEVNPLLVNMTWNYKANEWYRAFDMHGRTLLSLTFNYDILSIYTLTFGVEKFDAPVVDTPQSCFRYLTEEQKMHAVLDLVTQDFLIHTDEKSDLGEDPHACHMIIEKDEDYGEFKFNCCRLNPLKQHIECTENKQREWVKLCYILIGVVKIIALLFGPLFLAWVVHGESIRQTDYVVKLKEPINKTILVKKVQMPSEKDTNMREREVKQFQKFRRIVKSIPSEEIVHVSFRKLQLYVDHRRLMSEKTVPVGFFHFIYENVFRCRIRKWEPFASCCRESIFGSWSPNFLWFKLKKRSDCNIGCRKYLSWGHLAELCGGFLMLAAIPIPYYIRLIVYYQFEEEEISDRRDALEMLDLDPVYEHSLLHLLTPTHAALLILYIVYAVTFLLLSAFRNCNSEKFDNIAVGAIHDMRNISRIECIRMIVSHLVLPFEKFGICGFLVGFLYWPFAIPLAFIVSVWYCVPTLYLTGRFLFTARPACVKNSPRPTLARRSPHQLRDLSHGVTSLETCLLLENISPERNERLVDRDVCCQCQINRPRLYTACVSWLVGLLCILFMYSVLFMFCEVCGFILEVSVFTLMGLIVNADNSAKYLMLSFWVIMYSAVCYNNMYEKYLKLNHMIFEYIRQKMGDAVQKLTLQRHEKQNNTAFKYFSAVDMREQSLAHKELGMESEDECTPTKQPGRSLHTALDFPQDTIEYIEDKLNWRINSLVLFVDCFDVPRIPKELFHKICNIEAPGCPGPIFQNLCKATRQFLYMVLFLVFVLIVVMSFSDVYKMSSTNQLLITLAGGFVPFFFRYVLQTRRAEPSLSTYSFQGKVHQIIHDFTQVWPVFDLTFKFQDRSGDDGMYPQTSSSIPSGSHDMDGLLSNMDMPDTATTSTTVVDGRRLSCRRDPTHVDLLITIRDDSEQGNIRSEPASHGSHLSLNSINHSPEDGVTSNANRIPRNASMDSQAFDRRRPLVTSCTQTSVDTPRRPTSLSSSPMQTPPGGGRPVDLMVDMVRGNVRLRQHSDLDLDQPAPVSSGTGNGAAVWPQEDESSV